MRDRAKRLAGGAALAGLCLALTLQAFPQEKSKPKGPYVGQAQPGTEPRLFAPGFVNTGMEMGCTFTPDGKEFYFGRGRVDDILCTTEKKKGWTLPKKLPMNGDSVDLAPHVTADGTRLFFYSTRPVPPSTQPGSGIWVMDRVGTGWGNPYYHGPGGSATTAANGDLYLCDEEGRIAVQRLEDGQYTPPEPLGEGINDGLSRNTDPCIAWDESFLVFSSNRAGALGGDGDWDFYVSFRDQDGTWTMAQHFAEISSTDWDWSPSLTPDGKFLFFCRAGDWGGSIWWVSAEVVERYRPSRQPAEPRGGTDCPQKAGS